MSSNTSVYVLGYDFPHQKTCDVILSLELNHVPVAGVIAAPWRELNLPQPSVRSGVRASAQLHPRDLCERLGIRYTCVEHKAEELKHLGIVSQEALGVIGGARIIGRDVIDLFQLGIINMHPGILPYARGLDALLWSIIENIPIGVTAHLIDERVDAGKVLIRDYVQVQEDDSVFDLSAKLYSLSIHMLPVATKKALQVFRGRNELEQVDITYPNRGRFTIMDYHEINSKLKEYKEQSKSR